MSIFTKNIASKYWIISPRAMFTAIPGGYSWRAPAPKNTWPTIELFRPAVNGLISLIDEWGAANDLDFSRFDVAGFSQGGALTFTLGALYPGRVNKMGILAGFAPEGSEELVTEDLFSGKTIFVAHGTQDQMVPISMARGMIHLLKTGGGEVHYCESEVGHKLSKECLKAFEQYLEN